MNNNYSITIYNNCHNYNKNNNKTNNYKNNNNIINNDIVIHNINYLKEFSLKNVNINDDNNNNENKNNNIIINNNEENELNNSNINEFIKINEIIDINDELIINDYNDIKNNFRILETTGNGNCLFESLLLCMEINKEIINFENNKIIYITKLREIISNDILNYNNKNVINNLKENNININDFCNKIKKNYNWGGNYEMASFFSIYNCQINVICYERESIKININIIIINKNIMYFIWNEYVFIIIFKFGIIPFTEGVIY